MLARDIKPKSTYTQTCVFDFDLLDASLVEHVFFLVARCCAFTFQALLILPPFPVVCPLLPYSTQHITQAGATRHNQAMEHAKGTWALAAAAVCATGSLLYVAYKGGVALKTKVRQMPSGRLGGQGTKESKRMPPHSMCQKHE